MRFRGRALTLARLIPFQRRGDFGWRAIIRCRRLATRSRGDGNTKLTLAFLDT